MAKEKLDLPFPDNLSGKKLAETKENVIDAFLNHNFISDDFRKAWDTKLRNSKKSLKDRLIKECRIQDIMIQEKLLTINDIQELLPKVINNVELTSKLLNYQNENFTPEQINKYFEKQFSIGVLGKEKDVKELWDYEELPDGSLTLTKYKGTQTEIYVPDQIDGKIITTIGDLCISPFEYKRSKKGISPYKAERIEQIYFPNTIKYIGVRSCSDLPNLKTIVIPDSVTEIGAYCFSNCTNLEMAKLSENMEELAGRAFENCKNLANVTIPEKLKKIRDSAFGCCYKLNKSLWSY